MATMIPPPLPKIPGLHDYDLVRLLGEGGMGKVFLARHKRSGNIVVVKTIHEHLLGEAKTRQRFQQEIDLMRRFRHPNAVAFIGARVAAGGRAAVSGHGIRCGRHHAV